LILAIKKPRILRYDDIVDVCSVESWIYATKGQFESRDHGNLLSLAHASALRWLRDPDEMPSAVSDCFVDPMDIAGGHEAPPFLKVFCADPEAVG